MVEVKRIGTGRRELRRFTEFQIGLYAGNPYFVPPLIMDDVNTLDPKTNPAFDFCTAAYFMAFRDGRAVGRIAAMINGQVNERTGRRDARFGFVDFIDDNEVVYALFSAAEAWAKEQGMDRLVGPLGFTDLDHEGMLVEGFEELSTMATIYNYPYYPAQMRRLGYGVDTEWLEFVMDVPERIPDKYDRVAEIVKRRFGLRVKKFTSRKRIKAEYGRALFHLINEAYDGLYGYSPLTERQIDYYIEMYLNLLDLELVTLVVDGQDELVGVGISMPSMSRALQASRGRLFPLGWYHLLKGLKGRNDRVDLLLVGVKPEYQNKGVNALLFQDLIPIYHRKGYRWAESNPELHSNAKVQGQWEYFERRQHRRRVAFAKKL